MAKGKTSYRCSECGANQSKWAGQCNACEAWNTLSEEAAIESKPTHRHGGYSGSRVIADLASIDLSDEPRTKTGIGELDRVLGGGIVNGSVTLIGGDPGIGKSTLLIQVLAELNQHKSLYVSGEESPQQIALRAQRLGLNVERLKLLTETCVEHIIEVALKERPDVMVLDSIQTLYTEALQSAPGGVSQVRESAAKLVRLAKQHNIAMFIVGHVTKDGQLAGPRVLEHMVDTVLYFEGDPGERYRVLRAMKNRFGAVNELGIFAMMESGLKAVSNPSAIFLSRHSKPVSGSVIMVTREGTRPLLVELQALVADSQASQPRRVVLGLEQNRLAMLLAVLQRHADLVMHDQDVFINIVGGMRISETASDLPLILAALSSYKDKPFPSDTIAFGEIGLAGEIRPVPHGEDRLREAEKHGFKRALIPTANKPRGKFKGLEIIPVARVGDLLSLDLD